MGRTVAPNPCGKTELAARARPQATTLRVETTTTHYRRTNRARTRDARTRADHLTMQRINIIIQEVIHTLKRRQKMVNDKTVYVTYTNGQTNETATLEMTLTGKQIEQTMLRRMATLMPTAKNIRVEEHKPDAHQLEAKLGGKK